MLSLTTTFPFTATKMDMKATILYFIQLWGCTTIVWVEMLHRLMLLRDMVTNS